MNESKKPHTKVLVDFSELDTAIEKANRLVELLREASDIIDSLSGRAISSADDVVDKVMRALGTMESSGGCC